jgi:uncharacterized protein YjbI with pentapeptide repeats
LNGLQSLFNPSEASRSNTGSGRGAGNPVKFRIVGETNGIRMSGARLEDAALERVQFTDCRLLGVQASGARLRHVTLTRVAAPLSVWVKADAAHLRLDDCDLTEAVFMDADLPGLILRGCRLPRTDLRGARLAGADLRSSDLRGLRVTPRELEGVTVDAAQLPDLAHLLGVRVGESLPDPDTLP